MRGADLAMTSRNSFHFPSASLERQNARAISAHANGIPFSHHHCTGTTSPLMLFETAVPISDARCEFAGSSVAEPISVNEISVVDGDTIDAHGQRYRMI